MLLTYFESTSCNNLATNQTTNLHEVMIHKFHSIFTTYNVLPGQQVCMKCFKRAKDNVAASTTIIKNEVKINEKEEKDQTGPFKQGKGR